VLLADDAAFPGVLGPLAELLTVADGAADAIAAALGASASAIAVRDLAAAAEILHALRDQEAGRAELVIADSGGARATEGSAPSGSGVSPDDRPPAQPSIPPSPRGSCTGDPGRTTDRDQPVAAESPRPQDAGERDVRPALDLVK